eukprot:1383633-Pyramimonas_sp.AAC.1
MLVGLAGVVWLAREEPAAGARASVLLQAEAAVLVERPQQLIPVGRGGLLAPVVLQLVLWFCYAAHPIERRLEGARCSENYLRPVERLLRPRATGSEFL